MAIGVIDHTGQRVPADQFGLWSVIIASYFAGARPGCVAVADRLSTLVECSDRPLTDLRVSDGHCPVEACS